MRSNRVLMAVILGFLGSAVSSWAETTLCTEITSAQIPKTISAAGVYCLQTDITAPATLTTGAAITITANFVTLDLNGHRLTSAVGAATQAIGVYANQRQELTIKNGIIRGFQVGVKLDDASPFTTSQQNVIEGMRADNNFSIGIQVEGRGNLVRGCQAQQTGGSTSGGSGPYGIYVLGPANRVIDNDIVGQSGSGIYIDAPSTDVLALNNRISQMTYGIYFNGATGKFRDNVTTWVTVPYTSGTDVGNNN